MGCGAGLDAAWWATLETRDDPPEPRNYKVFAVDQDLSKVEPSTHDTPGIKWLNYNFEDANILPITADLIWSHDSFQYALNPMNTLANWNRQLNTNGMLVMALPQSMNYVYNRLTFKTESYNYFNYNISNLVYMLAVNGFDCRDAFFYKNVNSNWIYLAVYKNEEPMNPTSTSLLDLVDKNLLHDSVVASINKFGHIRQQDIFYPWLDKDFYQAKT
jgi:SAM-dependent methyltransferase